MYSIQYKLAFLLYRHPPSNYHTSLELGPMSQARTRSRTRSREDRVLEDAESLEGLGHGALSVEVSVSAIITALLFKLAERVFEGMFGRFRGVLRGVRSDKTGINSVREAREREDRPSGHYAMGRGNKDVVSNH
jgi:hypothetical protein